MLEKKIKEVKKESDDKFGEVYWRSEEGGAIANPYIKQFISSKLRETYKAGFEARINEIIHKVNKDQRKVMGLSTKE